MDTIKVRGSAVQRVLATLASRGEQLANEGMLVINVYVDSRLTPESFTQPISEGGLILQFVRRNLMAQWELDSRKFTILTNL